MILRFFLAITLIAFNNLAGAQSSEKLTRSKYFEKYKDMAIREMKRSGVPASITLAQGALESGDGNSTLARVANNHFGIKCHEDWSGKRIYQDDDAKNECFRKYPSVEDSYRDHSDYLRAKSRYAFLFELDKTDYKGWARGLKKAGYATSPTYTERLVEIIEDFNLSQYDLVDADARVPRERSHHSRNRSSANSNITIAHGIQERNRVKYVIAKAGDTYESMTVEFGKLSWEIAQYNDIRDADSLAPGQLVYIQPKRNKAEAGKSTHVVKEGETMYMISQLYAIKLERLYSLNRMNPGTKPSPGTVLQLRRPLKRQLPKPVINDTIDEGGEEEQIKVDLNLN
jgi:LysM repeat protein